MKYNEVSIARQLTDVQYEQERTGTKARMNILKRKWQKNRNEVFATSSWITGPTSLVDTNRIDFGLGAETEM